MKVALHLQKWLAVVVGHTWAAVDLAPYLAVDLELWTRFFRHAELYTYDLPLATFRYREGQRSEQFRDQYAREAKYVLDRELELLDERFRLTFRHYLPAKITPRDLPLSLELDLELSVCDPPIITVDDVDARTYLPIPCW